MTRGSWVPRPADHVSTSYLDDEAVLYDAVQHRPVLLNHTAAVVWAAVDGERTVSEITDEVATHFGINQSEVSAGVQSAIEQFLELALFVDGPS
jgi:Coenzyme PQQ synthesis protein D (PqqD)